MNNSDQIVIGWNQSDGLYNQIFCSQFDGTSWVHPTGLTDNISPDGSGADGTQKVSISDSGKIIISWEQWVGINNQIFYSYFNGLSWNHPSSLSDYKLPSGANSCVAALPMLSSSLSKILMICSYEGKNRLYELDGANNFLAPNATAYLSLPDESVFINSLKGFLVNDSLGVALYRSTYNSETVSPIRYMKWE